MYCYEVHTQVNETLISLKVYENLFHLLFVYGKKDKNKCTHVYKIAYICSGKDRLFLDPLFLFII